MTDHEGRTSGRPALFEFTGVPFEPGWRLLAGLDHPGRTARSTELRPLLDRIRQTLTTSHASALDTQARLQDKLIAGALR